MTCYIIASFLKWFKVNSLKPNPAKFQLMILGTNTDIKVNLFLDGNKIETGGSPVWNNH